ncbi:MAG: DUF6119 family protein [Candidatus Hodarchaeota archaeon]
MTEGKSQISIYKIAEIDLNDLCGIIADKGYINQDLENDKVSGFKLKLFYRRKPSNPKWKDFFYSVAKSGEDILKEKGWIESFVLILLNETKNNLYAVTGGLGFFTIQDFIYDDFGIDVFSRLIKKEDKILKSTREKSVVGGILGTTKHFRNNFNLFETDSFGKIYQELKASLDKKALIDSLGFSEEDIKKESACIAKSSFKINKAISFEQLLSIINGCEDILETKDPIEINNVEKLIKRKNEALIQDLEDKLYEQLWERYIDEDRLVSYSFDLCHKDYEKYLTASEYVVRKNTSKRNLFGNHTFTELIDIDTLFDAIKNISNIEKDPENKVEFTNLLKSLKIYSYDEEGNDLTKGDLSAHLLGDVNIPPKDEKFFFIDRSWYRIKDAFITDLNKSCKAFIEKNYYVGLDNKWNYPFENENQFNQKHIGEQNTIVLDKITPENIEPCDILKWDDQNLYLYHVKAGFGNTMRDLCSQIVISTNRVIHDLNSSKKYIMKIYHTLRNKIGGEPYFDEAGKQTEKYTEDYFLSLFDKKLVFVLAVLDTATDRVRDVKEIDKFKSTIAKFSLQELTKEMQGISVDFRITQINKT